MAEIHLPTKATQDSIKQDTNNILSNFPISGGTDFFEGNFHSSQAGGNRGNNMILDVNGKGILTHLSYNYTSTPEFTIEVDGGDIIRIVLGSRSTSSPFIPFKTSLKVYSESSTKYSSAGCILL